MPKEPKDQPTEKTPKGMTVPVPKRADFFANLKKVAKVAKASATGRGSRSGPQK
jgi:hypothetical protein